MAHRPLRRGGRANHGSDVDAGCRRRLDLLGLLVCWRRCALERRHRVAQIRDAPFHLGSPRHELVDAGVGGLDRGGVSRERGLQPLQESLDGGVHGGEVGASLPQGSGLDELSHIAAVEGWCVALIPDVRVRTRDNNNTLIYSLQYLLQVSIT